MLASLTTTPVSPHLASGTVLHRSGLLGPRVRLPVLLFGSTMLMLTGQRLVVFLAMQDRFGGVPAGDIARGFAIGLRFDAAIACMVSLPIIVAGAAVSASLLAKRSLGWVASLYAAIVSALLLFGCVADFYFFQEFGLRLNYQVFEYAHYPAVYRTIWQQYPVVWALVATLAFLAIAAQLFHRWGLGRHPDSPWWQGVWPLLLIPAAVIGIRGGLGNRPMNSSTAYVSDCPALVQLTLNGCYTLREAASNLAREPKLAEIYPLIKDEEALARARKLLAQPNDRFLDDPDNPLRRITDTQRPRNDYNVVLIVLESMSWPYIGALGGDARLTPNLSAIAEQGVLMDHCFHVGQRTAQGLSGTLAGFPDLPGSGVITRPQSEGRMLTLAQILRERGYQTLFIQGGQPDFDHKQAFFASNGYSRLIFEDQMPCRTFRNVVGWCDEDALNSVDHLANEMADRPFFISLLTLSFHRPFTIPFGRIQSVDPTHPRAAQLDTVRYTDWAVGQFMAKASKSRYFDRTIFVITADHAGGFKQSPMVPGASFRIPFILYAPAILGPSRRVSTVCSQTDIAPTILSLLGGSYEHCFFGSSVLDRPEGSGIALCRSGDNDLMLINSHNDVLVLPPSGARVQLFHLEVPSDLVAVDLTRPGAAAQAQAMKQDATSLIQSADLLFRRRSYNVPTTRP